MSQRIRLRNWAFTCWKLKDWEAIYKTNENIRAIGFSHEFSQENHEHLQGWLQLETPKEMNWLKKHVDGQARFSGMKKPVLANQRYCSKNENKTYVEYGEPKTQGQRTDLEKIQEDIKGGATLLDVMENNFDTYCRYRGGIKDYHAAVSKDLVDKWRDVEVIAITGPTGTGKTRAAYEDPDTTFKIQAKNLKWWDGYEFDRGIMIDEYDSQISITEMLGLLDGYRLRLDIKGSHTWANWNKVYITSNIPVKDWHPNAKPAHRDALFRRISKEYRMTSQGKIDVAEIGKTIDTFGNPIKK